MSNRNERKIGLGWTAERERVVAEITVEDGDGRSKFTDHTEGPTPDRVSITFSVIGPGRMGDRYEAHGQLPADERVIVRRGESDAEEATRAFIEEVWSSHHLNDINAGCDHMSPDMLARREGENSRDWQTRMLDTVTCPETGYKWGSAWLARAVPADVLTQARVLVKTGTLG